jgi:hypothetical protein
MYYGVTFGASPYISIYVFGERVVVKKSTNFDYNLRCEVEENPIY